MSNMAAGDAREVAIQIARYLRAHPDAADTLQGAAHWWISRPVNLDIVEHAMDMLEQAKVVQRHLLHDGTVIFRGGPGLAAFHDVLDLSHTVFRA
jgi:hypothetical protein